MKALFDKLLELPEYGKLKEDIDKDISPVLTTGVIDVQKIHMLGAIRLHENRPVMLVARDETSAESCITNLKELGEDAIYYPAKDLLFYSADVHSKDIL